MALTDDFFSDNPLSTQRAIVVKLILKAGTHQADFNELAATKADGVVALRFVPA